ncbi:MAG: beta-aspartyl-peptidase [Clostridiales bacterium]|nr:beta-aspartyl-peptidase [Clostridiales bacterium]
MIILLKGLECYTPEYIGKKDILISGGKIEKIQPEIHLNSEYVRVYDCGGLIALPGLIDQHVHILGGGGEEGFASRIAEIDADEILETGVTTLVGLLGADSCTRSLEALYAKANALEAAGITTYLYSGAYSMPPVTFTGSIVRDLAFIDKVIGIGEIAVSDHRSSHCGLHEMLKMASDTHLGGLLGKKAGILHLHMGSGKQGLTPVLQMLEHSELPMEEFVPTHVNRDGELFGQAVEYCKSGGRIDLTTGETDGISVPDAVEQLIRSGCSLKNVTVSSDANGSNPNGAVSRIHTLWEDILRCITYKKIDPETAFSLVTQNVAKVLKLYPRKGALLEGSDADILVINRNYEMKKLFSSGKLLKEYENTGEKNARKRLPYHYRRRGR